MAAHLLEDEPQEAAKLDFFSRKILNMEHRPSSLAWPAFRLLTWCLISPAPLVSLQHTGLIGVSQTPFETRHAFPSEDLHLGMKLACVPHSTGLETVFCLPFYAHRTWHIVGCQKTYLGEQTLRSHSSHPAT